MRPSVLLGEVQCIIPDTLATHTLVGIHSGAPSGHYDVTIGIVLLRELAHMCLIAVASTASGEWCIGCVSRWNNKDLH